MIDLTEKQKKIIGDILREAAAGYEVRAYGSRVDGTSHAGSDLDLVLMGKKNSGQTPMARLREAFEESNLPFRVDIFDWNRLPESFRINIEKKYVVLQEADDGLKENG